MSNYDGVKITFLVDIKTLSTCLTNNILYLLFVSEENHACFELTSKIIDFLLIENDVQPDTLIILSEEEIVFIDLGNEEIFLINN